MGAVCLASVSLPSLATRASAETAEELASHYSCENMQQALQTREQYELYGLRFESDKATLQPGAESLVDDIATTLKNFPEWV